LSSSTTIRGRGAKRHHPYPGRGRRGHPSGRGGGDPAPGRGRGGKGWWQPTRKGWGGAPAPNIER